jgi:hypothetical protein
METLERAPGVVVDWLSEQAAATKTALKRMSLRMVTSFLRVGGFESRRTELARETNCRPRDSAQITLE